MEPTLEQVEHRVPRRALAVAELEGERDALSARIRQRRPPVEALGEDDDARAGLTAQLETVEPRALERRDRMPLQLQQLAQVVDHARRELDPSRAEG